MNTKSLNRLDLLEDVFESFKYDYGFPQGMNVQELFDYYGKYLDNNTIDWLNHFQGLWLEELALKED